MWFEFIGFDDTSKKANIIDEGYNIIGSYNIGECFVDFMNIDFSSFGVFCNDLRKVLYPNNEDDGIILNRELSDEDLDLFFSKYIRLKEYILERLIKNYQFNGKSYDEAELDNDFRECVRSRISFNFLSWDFIFKCKDIKLYIQNIDEIISHPFIKLAYDNDPVDSIIKDNYYHVYNDEFYNPFVFCFDTEFNIKLNQLTANERYFLYTQLHIPGIDFDDTAVSYANITKELSGLGKYNYRDNIHDWIDKNITPEVINEIKSKNIKSAQLFKTYRVEDMLYAEFFKMISLDIKVMKCKNCGKYFILKGDYNTKYCDRFPTGEKYTCQKLATLKNQKDKLNNNPILKEYQKAYKRRYAQVSNKKLSNDEFRLWVEEATSKRDEAAELYNSNPDDRIVQEFKKYLGNK